MNNNLFFEKFAYIYDLVSKNCIDYDANIEFLLSLFSTVDVDVKSVLELGCGTGEYIQRLKKLGIKAVGIDISKAMIDIAQNRYQDKSSFLLGDMSNFDLQQKFDAVICMYSSILYLFSYGEIKSTIKRVTKHLNNKGLFILDLPNQELEISRLDNTETKSFETDHGNLTCLMKQSLTSSRFVETWNVDFNNSHEEMSFEELILDLEKIKQYLQSSGFSILKTKYGYTPDSENLEERIIFTCILNKY